MQMLTPLHVESSGPPLGSIRPAPAHL